MLSLESKRVMFTLLFEKEDFNMVFTQQTIQYRITLNTEENIFIVFDANNDAVFATGQTIEEAKNNLNLLIKE